MSEALEETPAELLRALGAFCEPPAAPHGRLAELLGLDGVPTAAEYADLFLFQLYPYASVYLGPEGMLGGEARDRIAGFWQALGQRPPPEPDHLAALLGLYASLTEPPRGADDAESILLDRARATLLHEHLAPWIFAFLARVAGLADGGYRRWALLLFEALRGEIERTRSEGGVELPACLRAAPPLPDPRRDGSAAFLDGLLAPARTGMIVTRSDLARLARAAGLGLRAGERRYALEHLLGQDAPAILRGLAGEARRQGAQHAERSAWLGAPADFQAERAGCAAGLLEDLAAEAGARPVHGDFEIPTSAGR